jgi:mono/diheme cytochrome c family protein
MRSLSRLVLVLVACGLAAWAFVARPNLPAAERGRRIAERWGCFTCHGPGGVRGVANHGRADRTVPGFEGDVMMYAKNADDLREWIHDGVPRRRAGSHTWQAERERGALRMPAFGRVLSRAQIDDLVAYVNAAAGDPEPGDSFAAAGLKTAGTLGCTGCHGPGGRLAARNPGSLKGYVPSWDGRDFPELVRDRREFGEWVERGVSERFRANPAAMFLLRRAALHMPAYREHVKPGDVDSLWAYVEWLRRTPH